MSKRLSITIAGAVSLGSYEAGVLYEVLDAIHQYNNDAQTSQDDRIVVDVMTGASAGGMTAVILAQKLLYAADEFRGPYDNPLYNTWVKRISLSGLQATADDEHALNSIFSSDLIEQISRETLLQRYAVVPPAPPVRHAAVGSTLRIGVALTNLNGIAYGYSVVPGGRFVYINHGDQLTRKVDAATCDKAAFWEPLRQAAVACGAFPFAFRTQDLQRSATAEADDYPPDNLMRWSRDPSSFTYSDGGILQNQPLGMAKNLVDLIDCHDNQEDRFYLFVSPHAKDPAANDTFSSATADYFRLLQRLISVVMGQSGFQDWITARRVNERIALLDKRAKGLKELIKDGQLNVAALAATAGPILNLFFPNGEHMPPGATRPETLDQARARIGRQYSDWMAELVDGSERALAYRDAVLAFETAAGLGARDCMTIYGVTAKDTELASGGLQAFLGFFDQRFRDHDYDVGRTHARDVFKADPLAEKGLFGTFQYTGSDIHPIDSRLDGLKLSHVPDEDLHAFKAGLRKRLNQALREIWGPVLALPAVPGSDLILESLLDRMIATM